MTISVAFPFLYMTAGILVTHFKLDKKGHICWFASSALTNIVIPIVVVYNIFFHESGVFIIMISIMMTMAIMLAGFFILSKDIIKSLCFCYLNIGWLGMPLVVSLYGDQAAMVMIAAYVGSSVFGNTAGVVMMIRDAHLMGRLIKTFKSPMIFSIFIGLALIPISHLIEPIIHYPYQISKVAMSALGMFVLGSWIAGTKWYSKKELWTALWMAALRFICFSSLISLVVIYGYYFNIALIKNNLVIFYFIGLLPPGAAIIVLETYYMKSGRSTSLISIGTIISIFLIMLYALITT